MSCVYVLKNTVNEKMYIGQTINLKGRMLDHKCPSGNGSIINRAINKYGWDNFKQYLFYVPENMLDYFEIEMIKRLNTLSPNGYNLRTGGSHGRFSEEICKKMSIAHMGKKPSVETKVKMSLSQKNREPSSEETRKKISITHTGMKHTEESKVKMRLVHKGYVPWNTGLHLSEEHKRKISNSEKGKVNTEEARAKMGRKGKDHPNFGQHHSAETRAKMSVVKKGKKLSEEHKQKLKGHVPWNKGEIGVLSEEIRERMSVSQKRRFKKQKEEKELQYAIFAGA